MAADPECPRCGGPLLPPTMMHEHFECARHGPVSPLQMAILPDGVHLEQLSADSDVPFWLPWPLPSTWLFTGLRVVGGGVQPIDAVAVGLTGQALLDGPADLIIVAEKPGTGLGARLAGLDQTDPGERFSGGVAATKVRTDGWPTPLWSIDADDRAVYVGEADGQWLWLIAWPDSAWSVIHDDLQLVDVRATGPVGDLPTGALMPRLKS